MPRPTHPTTLRLSAPPPSWKDYAASWGFVLLAGALVGYGLYRAYWGYTHHGPATLVWARPYLIGALLPTALAAGCALLQRRRRHVQVLLTPEGILWLPNGPRLRWEAIHAVRADFRPGRATLHLDTTHGHLTLSTPLAPLEAALAYIERALYARLRPTLQQAWRRGEAIPFGPLAIQQQGLTYRDSTVPWERVRSLEVRQGHLVIELGQRTWRIPVHHIPNLGILLRWLHEGREK